MKNGNKINLSLISFKAFNKELFEEINNLRKYPDTFYEKLIYWKNYIKDDWIEIPNKIRVKLPSIESFNQLINIVSNLNPSKALEQIVPLTQSTQIYQQSLENIEQPDSVKGNTPEQLLSLINMFCIPKGLIGEVIQIGIPDPELVVLFILMKAGNRNVLLHEKFNFIGISSGYVEKLDDMVTIMHFCERIEGLKSLNEKLDQENISQLSNTIIFEPFTDYDKKVVEDNKVIDYRITKKIIHSKDGDKLLISKYIKFIDGSSDEWQFKKELI